MYRAPAAMRQRTKESGKDAIYDRKIRKERLEILQTMWSYQPNGYFLPYCHHLWLKTIDLDFPISMAATPFIGLDQRNNLTWGC